MNSKLKVAIFDMDGTLVDSTEAHIESWIETFRSIGVHTSYEEVSKLMGRTSEDIAKSILDMHGMRSINPSELARRKDKLFEQEFTDRVKAFPYAKKALKALHERGIRIAVVSSNPKQLVVKILKEKSLYEYVDVIIGQDEVSRGKPHPEPILLVLSKLKVKPEEAVVIGDSTYDVQAARAAGVIAIGVCTGISTAKELKKAGAKTVVKNLREFYEKLDPIMLLD